MDTTKFIIAKTNFITIVLIISLFSCTSPIQTPSNTYHFVTPAYHSINLNQLSDSLTYYLGENSYNNIKSFNTFTEKGTSYISFYDRRSESLVIYSILDARLYKKIDLKVLYKGKRLYKISAFIKSFDSIFIINNSTLSIFDSANHRRLSIDFNSDQNNSAAIFDSNKLPVLIGSKLYALGRPRVNSKSLNDLRKWQVLYTFDLLQGKANIQYHLPLMYQENFYGDHFLDYNFCYNSRGNFVFSFPADTLLYETDLNYYNHAYFARSQLQKSVISPVDKKSLEENEGFKEYSIRDSYGSVFYDGAKGYYLRLSRHKISPEEFTAKKRQQRTVLILDANFKIIGESNWPEEVDFNTLFITPNGKLYARTNFKDENALHFVRFDYLANKDSSTSLTKNDYIN